MTNRKIDLLQKYNIDKIFLSSHRDVTGRLADIQRNPDFCMLPKK